ncbi:hypothetical protein [Paenibacillus protaetiae]|uniref:Uncharacterized protein n=1 Tax=Paenibacillus protaetiae TaxID=2509456 RepID=A0A4P6EWK0_9BACL|nr:hypothetical protein [Paenibacillus protaetiae]QAY67096.1 hypothetical protein ET464_12515 [Paenibacillus protaetiae]
MTYMNGQTGKRMQYIPPSVPAGSDCGCGGPRRRTGAAASAGPGLQQQPAYVSAPGPSYAAPGMMPGTPYPANGGYPPQTRPVFPMPIPFPAPQLQGPIPAAPVTVEIESAAGQSQKYRLAYRPGLTLIESLLQTGAVQLSPGGQIASVHQRPVEGQFDAVLTLNGEQIPLSLLYFPIHPNDTVRLNLVPSFQPGYYAPGAFNPGFE